VTAGFRHGCREKGRSPRREASPSMGSKGIGRMVLRVWASTGFHPASPGPAMALTPNSWPGCSRVPVNPVDDRRNEPVAASAGPLDCAAPAPVLCRPVSGFDPKRRLPGEAAIERPINSPMLERQAFPQAAWSHAQGVGWQTYIRLASRAWRSRPRTTLDRLHPPRTSCQSPFDPIEGNARPARAFLPAFTGMGLGK